MYDIVIFGGTGDLSLRKLLPSLYYLLKEAKEPQENRIVCISRTPLERVDFLLRVKEKLEYFIGDNFNPSDWEKFETILSYIDIEFSGNAGWNKLYNFIHSMDHQDKRDIIYHLSVPPALFTPICKQLKINNLTPKNSRVIVEKPLGENFESANKINGILTDCFSEKQIYRIDHYLAKEAVQNILHLRFSNHLIETVWNNQHIDQVEITVSEQIGVEGRAEFFDHIGTLRDMVQNHLIQLLTYITMEVPKSLSADDIRDRKIEVINALQPINSDNISSRSIRGQYLAGEVNGKPVSSYKDDLKSIRNTIKGTGETFVALKVNIDNGRWRGVPFILKTGKRMEKRLAEIRVKFNPPSNDLYGSDFGNFLVIEIQPKLTVSIQMMMKQLSGSDGVLGPHTNQMEIGNNGGFLTRVLEDYEKLLGEVIKGNQTFFVRDDEIMASWKWIDAIRDAWTTTDQEMKTYISGSNGPNFDK
jgi:glucose-6-phosphate 1-dehydrogenase